MHANILDWAFMWTTGDLVSWSNPKETKNDFLQGKHFFLFQEQTRILSSSAILARGLAHVFGTITLLKRVSHNLL